MSDCKNDDGNNGNDSPKIYKVIYDGGTYTEGTVPVNDNLYAKGDTFNVIGVNQPGYELLKNKRKAAGWYVEGAASVKPCNADFGGGNFFTNDLALVTFDENNIFLTAKWWDDEPLSGLIQQ